MWGMYFYVFLMLSLLNGTVFYGHVYFMRRYPSYCSDRPLLTLNSCVHVTNHNICSERFSNSDYHRSYGHFLFSLMGKFRLSDTVVLIYYLYCTSRHQYFSSRAVKVTLYKDRLLKAQSTVQVFHTCTVQ